MTKSDRRTNVQAVTDGYPNPGDDSTHAPARSGGEKRRQVRRIADKLGGYSVSPNSNAAWMKKFLRPDG